VPFPQRLASQEQRVRGLGHLGVSVSGLQDGSHGPRQLCQPGQHLKEDRIWAKWSGEQRRPGEKTISQGHGNRGAAELAPRMRGAQQSEASNSSTLTYSHPCRTWQPPLSRRRSGARSAFSRNGCRSGDAFAGGAREPGRSQRPQCLRPERSDMLGHVDRRDQRAVAALPLSGIGCGDMTDR
jgi:hypothetical protein